MKGRMGSSIAASQISQAEVRAELVSKCFQRKVSRLNHCQFVSELTYQIPFRTI